MDCVCIVHNFTKESYSGLSFELAHHLAKKGVDVLFISHRPYFEKPLFINDYKGFIHVYSWPTKKRPTDAKSFFWFARIFLKYHPSKLIGHFVGSNISAIAAKILSSWRTQTLIYYHTLSHAIKLDYKGSDMSLNIKRLRKKFFYNIFCDIIVCPSDLAKKDFIGVYGSKRKSGKCQVVINPIIDRFKGFAQPGNMNTIKISYLGRLEPTKGVNEMLDGFINHRSEDSSRIILHIAGAGPLEDKIKDTCSKHPQIIFEGYKNYDEVDDYIRKSDFMILPSLSDNLPTVGLESLMNGVPILLSEKTGLADYILDGEEGYLFQPSVKGISDVLERAKSYIYKREAMAIMARQKYLNKFGVNTYLDRMNEVLQLHRK